MANQASEAQEASQRGTTDALHVTSSVQHPPVEPEQQEHVEREPNPLMLLGRKLLPAFFAMIALGVLANLDNKEKEAAARQNASASTPSTGNASAGTSATGTSAIGLTTGVKAMTAGTILASLDAFAEGRDYTLQAPAGASELEIKVWDYAAEDGDVIQLRVNGQIASAPISLMNAPVSVTVPLGKLEVLGIRDGGGGITYAINFPQLNTSISNATRPESLNQYHFEQPGQTGARP